jgi:hypothetical protein
MMVSFHGVFTCWHAVEVGGAERARSRRISRAVPRPKLRQRIGALQLRDPQHCRRSVGFIFAAAPPVGRWGVCDMKSNSPQPVDGSPLS